VQNAYTLTIKWQYIQRQKYSKSESYTCLRYHQSLEPCKLHTRCFLYLMVKKKKFLICLFSAISQLQKKSAYVYITSSKVPNLAVHLLFKQCIIRNHSARARYFLVLDSFRFENLKQMEILFHSEEVYSGQITRNMGCVMLKFNVFLNFSFARAHGVCVRACVSAE
jgi:hypothetical protein